MENSVGTFRTDRLMQGDCPSQVTVNTGSTVLVNATALGLAYPAARQMACTSCSVGISDLKPLTGTSADQLPHTKSRSLGTA